MNAGVPWLLALALTAHTALVAAATYGPYEAELLRVVDGDTYDLRVRIWPHPLYDPPIRVRLANADTPEVAGAPACEQALAARAADHARMLLQNGRRLQIVDVVADSLGGRFRARVLIDGVDLGELLKATTHGREYRPNDKRPWCTSPVVVP